YVKHSISSYKEFGTQRQQNRPVSAWIGCAKKIGNPLVNRKTPSRSFGNCVIANEIRSRLLGGPQMGSRRTRLWQGGPPARRIQRGASRTGCTRHFHGRDRQWPGGGRATG